MRRVLPTGSRLGARRALELEVNPLARIAPNGSYKRSLGSMLAHRTDHTMRTQKIHSKHQRRGLQVECGYESRSWGRI